jgi:site-specific DNA-methyltransferase (adenine-specific)
LGQQSLFSPLPDDLLSIEMAADELRVSTASVRNWVKAGYLIKSASNMIDKSSLESFRKNLLGTAKLVKRANKSHFDENNHRELLTQFQESLDDLQSLSGLELSDLYEKKVSISHKNAEGIYYTPKAIVTSMFDEICGDVAHKKFIDPCCGSGNFLVAALERGFLPENIYGYDTDKLAIAIAQKRLKEKTGVNSVNIIHGDFLSVVSLGEIEKKFDVILTNPPWGKKLPRERKDHFFKFFGLKGNADTSGLFLLAGIQICVSGGVIGMLMPEAFFSVTSFQEIRNIVLKFNIIKLGDHGKSFKGVLAGAKSIIFKPEENRDCEIECYLPDRIHLRTKKSFKDNVKQIINFQTQREDIEVIEYVNTKPHISLKGRAKWGLGIVTGNNSQHIVTKPRPGCIAVYKGSQIFTDGLLHPTMFISEDLSKYQQVASREIFEAREKLIYRFISSKLIFYCDKNQEYVLNSANMLVPDHDFPVKSKVMASFLSCSFMNWYFTKVFGTYKVLRSDLESLPIFSEFLSDHEDFDENDLLKYLDLERSGGGFSVQVGM